MTHQTANLISLCKLPFKQTASDLPATYLSPPLAFAHVRRIKVFFIKLPILSPRGIYVPKQIKS
jgi:hypothetical protein